MYSAMFCRMSPYILNPCDEKLSWAKYSEASETGTGLTSVSQMSEPLHFGQNKSRGKRHDEEASFSPAFHLWAKDLVCQRIKSGQALITRPKGCKIAIPIIFSSSPDKRPDFSAGVMLFLNVKESRDVSAQTFMHIMPIVIQPEKIFTVPQLNLGLWKIRYKRYQNI